MSARTILLTGFPSFASRYLAHLIHEREPDSELLCVVLPKELQRAQEIVAGWGPGARVTLLSGDLCALDLGLTGKQYLDLCARVTDVYHLAGLWHTSADARALHKANVVATTNIAQAVREMRALRRFNHFSTAFICGDRTGVILEEEFDERQRFLNAYEETQFLAEKEVRKFLPSVPTTIYRPSLIVGHSRTGQIDRRTGFYAVIQPLLNLPVEVPLPLPGAADAPLNLVPVDYVVEALHHLSLNEATVGRTFHLVDPNPLSARRTLELVAQAAGKPLPRGSVPVVLARLVSRTPMLEKVLRPGLQILHDFNRWSLFHSGNTMALTRGGPWCPTLPEYVEPLIKHLTQDQEA